MAKQGGLGRGLSEIMADQPKGDRWHGVLSPIAFAAATERNGGATMDAVTGNMVNVDTPETDTYVVGKEPDVNGYPIDTTSIRSTDILTKVGKIQRNIVKATKARPGTAVGSWKTKGGAVDIDASGLEPDLDKAMKKAEDRDEKAIFSTKKFRESGYNDGDIANPKYKGK